jgi:hypothetical protein
MGKSIRVVWSGAKYSDRGRKARLTCKIRLEDACIAHFEKINACNDEKLFEQRSDTEILWDFIPTGNFVGFDFRLDDTSTGRLLLETNFVNFSLLLKDAGLEEIVFEAGGFERRLRVLRMPQTNHLSEIRDTMLGPLKPRGIIRSGCGSPRTMAIRSGTTQPLL